MRPWPSTGRDVWATRAATWRAEDETGTPINHCAGIASLGGVPTEAGMEALREAGEQRAEPRHRAEEHRPAQMVGDHILPLQIGLMGLRHALAQGDLRRAVQRAAHALKRRDARFALETHETG